MLNKGKRKAKVKGTGQGNNTKAKGKEQYHDRRVDSGVNQAAGDERVTDVIRHPCESEP